MSRPVTCSVVIVTLARPDCVRLCLQHLFAQQPARPDQILVVDGSPDDRTREVCKAFPTVQYLRNEKGIGHTTDSRNIGVLASDGDVIAFLDDDSYAHPQWLAELMATYDDDDVGAVGGRALRAEPGEAEDGTEMVGRISACGMVLGYFGADTQATVEVDHLIGCNMSFRREALADTGGFRDGFTGSSCFREETDIFFVLRRMGWRTRFNPRAAVDHVGAPRPKHQRAALWPVYYANRNHAILLMRNHGPLARVPWINAGKSTYKAARAAARALVHDRRPLFALALTPMQAAGTLVGLGQGYRWWRRQGGVLQRDDQTGRRITAQLGGARSASPVPQASPSLEPAACPTR